MDLPPFIFGICPLSILRIPKYKALSDYKGSGRTFLTLVARANHFRFQQDNSWTQIEEKNVLKRQFAFVTNIPFPN